MPKTFRDQIGDNKEASVWLVLGFCLFVTLLAVALSYSAVSMFADKSLWQDDSQAKSRRSVYNAPPPKKKLELELSDVLWIAGLAASTTLALAFLGYYSGDDFILRAHRALPIDHFADPELINTVEEMAISAGIPKPRVYMIRDNAPNAFATGRDPDHAAIAITTGLRNKLTRDELQGVIAHEMSHIRNYDIRLMLLMAVLLGSVVMLCDIFWNALRWGSGWGGGYDDYYTKKKDDDNPLAGEPNLFLLLFAPLGGVLALLAPVVAQLIQLAVSREREYLADASAVELTRYPQGLANALRKISGDSTVLRTANRGTAHLYIANPIRKYVSWSNSVFSSHPPMEERIRRLEALVHAPPPAPAAVPIAE